MFLDQGWWHLQLHWPMQRRPKVPEIKRKKNSSFEKFSQNWKQSCEILQHFTEHNDTGHHVLWEASTLFCSVETGNEEYRVKRTTFLGSSPLSLLKYVTSFYKCIKQAPPTHTHTNTHTVSHPHHDITCWTGLHTEKASESWKQFFFLFSFISVLWLGDILPWDVLPWVTFCPETFCPDIFRPALTSSDF